MKALGELLPSKDFAICPDKHFRLAGYDLCPLELATHARWLEGLECLLQSGGDPTHALSSALLNVADWAFLRLVLRDDLPKAIPIRIDRRRFGGFAMCYQHNRDMFSEVEAQKCIIEAVKKRRDRLQSIWAREGSPGNLHSVDPRNVLDAYACTIFNLLRSRHLDVPPALDPGTVSIWHCHRGSPFPPDLWYVNGFMDIDTPGDDGRTPLERIMKEWWETSGDAHRGLWFFRRGVCPEFSREGGDGCPNMLFYFGERIVFKGFLEPDDIVLLAPCDPLTTDGCDCYCSDGGCLPVVECSSEPTKSHGDWRSSRSNPEHIYDVQTLIIGELHLWADSLSFTDDQRQRYVEAWVRRELFQFLAMTHTCGGWKKTGTWAKPPKALLREIQCLEGLQLILLEVFMEAFREWCEQNPGKRKLDQWWQLVNSIFFRSGEPNWKSGQRERLSVSWESWEDILKEIEDGDATQPAGRSRPWDKRGKDTKLRHSRDRASDSILRLPGAWPDDGYMGLPSDSESPTTALVLRASSEEAKAYVPSFGERIAYREPVWSFRRQTVRSQYFMEEVCQVFSGLLNEDVISAAMEAFLEELDQGF